MKRLFAFYIHSSIHVSLAVTALLVAYMLNAGLPLDPYLIAVVFLGSINGYNFVKYASLAKLHHRSLTTALRSIQIFSGLCFLALLYFLSQLPIRALLILGLVGVCTLLYAIPFIKNRNARSLPGLKIFIVALSWALVTCVLPAVSFNREIAYEFTLSKSIQHFCLVIALIVPFEIRDMDYDATDLKTLPQVYGILKTKIIGWMCLVIVAGMAFLANGELSIVPIIIAICLTSLAIWLAPKPDITFYCAFWVESIPIAYGLLMIFDF